MTSNSPIWRPMTQHKTFGDPIHVDRAQGSILYTKDGRKIIDGISSWWVNTHGHCHPKIVKAVQDQATQLEQVIFAGFTHNAAEQLTAALLKTVHQSLGDHLNYVFYSDSGSTAIEVALKMAIGYHAHKNTSRKIIVALDGGYHGDTFGTMATGARGVFNEIYSPYLFNVIHLPFPYKGEEQKTIDAYDALLKSHKNDIAAFVFEPIVQGAAGMRMYDAATLKTLANMSKTQNILTIADEVMTGFGRTGTMFACEQSNFSPDLLCLSKGITGGFLPMGATLCRSDIYDAFYDNDRAKQFMHSTSFTGNPLACAAALANLEIWNEEPVFDRISKINAAHQSFAKTLTSCPKVMNIRIIGSIMAFDIQDDTDGYLSDMGPKLYDLILDHNVLLRPIGNTVYILPPYCTTDAQMSRIYDAILQAAQKLGCAQKL